MTPPINACQRSANALNTLSFIVMIVIFTFMPLQALARNVLVLVNDDLDSSFSLQLKAALIEKIKASEANIYLHEVPGDYEYLIDQISSKATQNLAANIELRFSSGLVGEPIEFDEIIAQGTAPGLFLDDVPNLYPQAERSFFHIPWQPKTGKRYSSGIDPALSFELILSALPKTEHIVLYHATTDPTIELTDLIEFSFESVWLSRFRTDFSFEIKNLLSPSDSLIRHAEFLPENSVAVYVLYHDMRPPDPAFHAWLEKQSHLPLFGVFEHNIESFFGGAIISADGLAQTIVTKANNEKNVFTTTNFTKKIINWTPAKKMGVDTDNLSKNIELRGIPDTSVSRGMAIVLTAVAALIIFILILALLAISRKRLNLERERWAEIAEHAAEQSTLITKLKSTRELSAIGEWFWRVDESFCLDAVGAVLMGLDPPLSGQEEYIEVDGWNNLLHPDDLDYLNNYFHCIKAGLKESELVIRIIRLDKEERVLRISGTTPETDSDGTVMGVRGLMRDITETHNTRGRLLKEIEGLKEQLRHSQEAN